MAIGISTWILQDQLNQFLYNNDNIKALSVWDARTEQLIAEYGYGDDSFQKFVTKPPLYAVTTRLISTMTGLNLPYSMFLLHSISVFFSFIWVYRFAELMLGSPLAWRVTLLFPFSLTGTGFIYVLNYHEPFSIAILMAIFYHLRKGNDYLASILTALFVLSRSQAIWIILILIAYVIWDGRQVWRNNIHLSTRYDMNIRLTFGQMLDSGLRLCAIPLITFMIWQTLTSIATGWQFAPLYAQRFHDHIFGLYKPYELVRPFIALVDANTNPIWIPYHLLAGLAVIHTLICLFYLCKETKDNHQLIPSTSYAIFIVIVMAFVGLYAMPRLLHATTLSFAIPIMVYKIGRRTNGFVEFAIWIILIVLSVVMMFIIIHFLVFDYVGYFP